MTQEHQFSLLIDVVDFYDSLKDYDVLFESIESRIDKDYRDCEEKGQESLHKVNVLLSILKKHHDDHLERLKELICKNEGNRYVE